MSSSELTRQTFRVVSILSPSRLVLNCGTDHSIGYESRFRIYAWGEQIADMDGTPLQRLYIPRGIGRVVVLQQKICTVESNATSAFYFNTLTGGGPSVEPFDGAEIGDYADLISK